MAQVNTTQGYANQQPSPKGTHAVGAGVKGSAASTAESNGILPEDAVHLRQTEAILQRQPQLSLKTFKQSLGQDISFVKETMRNKVAEYGLPPQAKLNVSKDAFGNIAVTGHIQEDTLQHIQSDLNKNQAFKRSFDRISLEEPTLNYLDTANKLSKTYGVGNNIVNAIVSENSEFNSLNDIAHRYAKYGETVAGNYENATARPEPFRFTA
ncbi:MAG: hypothetical protein H7A01_07395 [Hahellaceae bacterium]|jgi:hypothetical protein|nr:hypothetical protein [Hahellaceae bacterium]MCP5211661.1 hypothetical protein [Hahellaceae bacterium]